MKRKISYDEAIRYLYGLQKYGIKFGLSKTANLLRAFGNPHHRGKYIHVAGTNGKGSVAAMVASVLSASGLRVGFYSSPHLVRFTERFLINGVEMPRDEAAGITGELMDVIQPKSPPTFFEVVTAMALIYFARKQTDISVIEVGMGGRLDATNVIRPLVSVITNISLEHQFFLGSRIIDIAGEKAGIIKKGVSLVTGATQPAVLSLFGSLCERRKARLYRVGRDVRYRKDGLGFTYRGLSHNLKGTELGLRGGFQRRNAATALGAVELLEQKGFRISPEDILSGLKKVSWPGRIHVFQERPAVVLDGAHNPGAAKTLSRTISEDFSYRHLILVIGVMKDKDIQKILQELLPLADYVIYTRPEYYRAANPEELQNEGEPFGRPGEVAPTIARGLERAREMADPEDMILVTGSLFTVGEAMTCLDPETYRPDELRW